MIGFVLLGVAGAVIVYEGVQMFRHRGTYLLDANLPAPMVKQVLDALRTENDPVKLDALAAQLVAYPLAQALLRKKAADLRSQQHKVSPPPAPPKGPLTIPTVQPGTDIPGLGNRVTQNPGDEIAKKVRSVGGICPEGFYQSGDGWCMENEHPHLGGTQALTNADCADNEHVENGKCVPNAPALKPATPPWEHPTGTEPTVRHGVAEGDNLGQVRD